MARIPTYEIDSVIHDLDMLLGTDGNNNEFTKNFTLSGIAEYVIDKLIEPNAVQSTVPVFRNVSDVQGGNATRITSSIINQNIYPNGTNISISGTLDVEKKAIIKGGEGESGILQLNCSENSHGIKIQGPPHSAGASYTMILPNDMGTSGKQLTTDGVNQLYWADPEDDNLNIAADTNTGSIDLDTQTLTISGGTLLSTTVSPNGGQNIVVDHDSVSRTDNSNQVTLSFGDTFDAETSIQSDSSGHIELVNTTTYTLPSTPVTSIVAGTNVTISPTNGIGDVTVNATNQIPGNNVIGTGTANTVPIWSNSQELSNSNITQDATTGQVTISSAVNFQDNLSISGTVDMNSGTIENVADPVSAQEAATKAYVDANTTSGTGTTNTLTLWSDGPNGVISDSIISQSGSVITALGEVILGTDNTTSAISTYVVGKQNSVSSDDNYVFGFNNAIGNSSSSGMALGHGNSIDGPNAYAIGRSNDLNSKNDYAFGFNNTTGVNANLTVAIGRDNNLEGSQSYAFGRSLKDGAQDNTVMIGRFNATPTTTSRIVFGTGFADTDRKNAIEIQAGTTVQSGLLFKALQASNSYADDAAAAAGGVELGELYRNGNVVQIRMT